MMVLFKNCTKTSMSAQTLSFFILLFGYGSVSPWWRFSFAKQKKYIWKLVIFFPTVKIDVFIIFDENFLRRYLNKWKKRNRFLKVDVKPTFSYSDIVTIDSYNIQLLNNELHKVWFIIKSKNIYIYMYLKYIPR